MPPYNEHDEEPPPGWTTETRSDEIHSWVGHAERVVCTRKETNEEWIAYSQPRSELGAPTQIPLTESPVRLDQALSIAFDYMERNSETK